MGTFWLFSLLSFSTTSPAAPIPGAAGSAFARMTHPYLFQVHGFEIHLPKDFESALVQSQDPATSGSTGSSGSTDSIASRFRWQDKRLLTIEKRKQPTFQSQSSSGEAAKSLKKSILQDYKQIGFDVLRADFFGESLILDVRVKSNHSTYLRQYYWARQGEMVVITCGAPAQFSSAWIQQCNQFAQSFRWLSPSTRKIQ